MNQQERLGALLLLIARNSISSRFGLEDQAQGEFAQELSLQKILDAPGTTFVTLTKGGHLRGCIGSLEPRRSLRVDVAENAISAAFHDPRFPPLGEHELLSILVEVSLLSAPEAMTWYSEAEALSSMRPGVDGIVFSSGCKRATFLPQVWDQLPEPALFLSQLRLKAGLPADWWSADVHIKRYTVNKWKEVR